MRTQTRRPYSSLKAYRKAQGWNQRDAAKHFGVTQAHWSKLELGRCHPRRALATRLMTEAGVPLEALMGIAS